MAYDALFREDRHTTGVKDVAADEFVHAMAQHLKSSGKFPEPKWVDIVKTAPRKELAPYDRDWLFVHAAAVARSLYVRPGAGIGGLRKYFGGKQRRGTNTNNFGLASGKIQRYCAQQLEKMGYVEKNRDGGRYITSLGRKNMDTIAAQVHA